MKKKNFDAVEVWKQLEDVLVPRLEMSVTDRAVYSHLLRHTRLEGKSRLRFSIPWLARGVRLSDSPVRVALRRLVARRVLRLVERDKRGHLIELFLPGEIRRAFRRGVPPEVTDRPTCGRSGRQPKTPIHSAFGSLEDLDFTRNPHLRKAIHAREGGRCFYCLGRIPGRMLCLDHVQPQAQMGLNSYRNLVSCCMECNPRKGEMHAKDFLRQLCREQRLSPKEFAGRLKALEELAAGRLRPIVATSTSLAANRGRTRVSTLQ
jgi:5-methylcytosine-specific restriction endonuclease McrA